MLSYISSLDPVHRLPDNGRKLVVLGCTGSIGKNVLDVLGQVPGQADILGLAAGDNVSLLAEQAAGWRPSVLGVRSERHIPALKERLPKGYAPEIVSGQEGFVRMAGMAEAHMVVSSQVGAAGLAPTLAAVRAGKVVALANKESLVLAGPLLRQACAESDAVILPVDSEHNAIFQALAGHDWGEVKKLVLTASGGPFWSRDKSFLERVGPDQALAHPNWSMGAKISIDSATLMNKGLEVIEACHLYGADLDEVEVLIHPESIVHSLVEYHDGSLLAHMGIPDMRIPIAHALSYPRRMQLHLDALDLVQLSRLSFARPDHDMFPCLNLAKQALTSGPSYPIVLNAANEVAVEFFLGGRIAFLDIARLNRQALEAHTPSQVESLEDVQNIDQEARLLVRQGLQP